MAKKMFKSNLEGIENPALQFISNAASRERTQRKEQDIHAPIPEGYKLVPEAKSKRLQLLMQPSLYGKIKEKAEETGTSVNDTIHNILSKAMREK